MASVFVYSPPHVRALLGIVVLSGGASLMYQAAWTRRLITVTSATVTAQAIVLAVFMAGLGLGALVAGRRAGALAKPVRGYAAVELLAAVLAVISVPLIASSEVIRGAAIAVGLSPTTALWTQLAGVSAALLVPCTALGASLPLLVEAVERTGIDGWRRGRFISLLYAFNTLGAVAGSLVAGFILVEWVGLTRTCLAGAAFGAMAAGGALLLSARLDRGSAQPEKHDESGRPTGTALVAAAMAGFVGLGAEVVWTRLVSLVVLNTVYAFTQVLAGVLLGIAAGGYLAAAITNGAPDNDALRLRARTAAALGQALAAVWMALVPFVLVEWARDPAVEKQLAAGFSVEGLAILLLIISPPSALIGATLPLLVTASTDVRGARALGTLYGLNTLGSVLGSLAIGFFILPSLGTHAAGLLIEMSAVVVALVLAGDRPLVRTATVGATAIGTLLFFSLDIPRQLYEARLPEDTHIKEFREGQHSDVMVTESDRGIRRIWVNSSWVAGTGGGHRLLGHIPSLFVDEPRQALGIALGTGQTFSAALDHGFERFDCVELDPGVIELSKRWFSDVNGGLFERPNVHLHNDDGRAYLRTTDQRFDLVLLEPLQAWSAGTSNLYSVEFYEDARARMTEGGVVGQWIPFYGQSVRETKAMVRAALAVFEHATLWLDGFDGILLVHRAPVDLGAVLDGRLHRRGLTPMLADNFVDQPQDLLALFLAGRRGLEAWVEGVPLLEDDHPFLEFAAARDVGGGAFGSILASIQPHLESIDAYWAQTSSVGQKLADRVGQKLADRVNPIREGVLRAALADGPSDRARALEGALAAVPDSRLLSAKYTEVMLQWAFSPGAPPKAQEAIYLRALRHHPSLGKVLVNLALLRIRTGRKDAARPLLARLRTLPGFEREVAVLSRMLQ